MIDKLMFGEKNSAAIYLERNSLVFVHPEKQIVEKLSFENTIMNHLEIKNGEQFVQLIKTFLDPFPKESTVIFLSKPIIFEREIEVKTKDTTETVSSVDTFLAMVPIAADKISSMILSNERSIFCLATNKEYFELVVKGAQLSGLKIRIVAPAFLFNGLEGSEGLVVEAVSTAIDDKELLKKANFIDGTIHTSISVSNDGAEPSQDSKGESDVPRSNTRRVIFIIVLIALLSFSVIFSYMNGLFDRFFPTQPSIVVAPSAMVVSPLMDASVSGNEASAAAIRMEDLRAKITNGTGISGQATRAQDALHSLNLRETLLDLEASKGAVVTQIGYDSRVPIELVDQVKDVLAKIFTKVEEKEASDTGEFDLLITTGAEKTVR